MNFNSKTSSKTYPYPKGEHMGGVGAQICDYDKFAKLMLLWKRVESSISRRVFGHGDWYPPSFGSHLSNPISTEGGADYAHPILMSPPTFRTN